VTCFTLDATALARSTRPFWRSVARSIIVRSVCYHQHSMTQPRYAQCARFTPKMPV